MDASTAATLTGNASSDKMNLALQVALQTMKERCIQLQRRVSNMEDENQRLRDGLCSSNDGSNNSDLAELHTLRSQVTELQRQKEQLSEHISMVSNENRRLWSRLSQISKEQQLQIQATVSSGKEEPTVSPNSSSSSNGAAGANQNLIRSKTFTQHSPNPHLRQKIISDGMRDISLEEIALDDFGASEAFAATAYGLQLNDTAGVGDSDANVDAKRCMEGLQDLRREAMKQQQELNSALMLLETRIALQPCSECAQKTDHKPEMADKSLETDESINNELKFSQEAHTEHNGQQQRSTTPTSSRLNIIQEKIKADTLDKTCPMCGKTYSNQVSFKAFQDHVEMHFVDDSLELENSIERNYEFISHTVGDF